MFKMLMDEKNPLILKKNSNLDLSFNKNFK